MHTDHYEPLQGDARHAHRLVHLRPAEHRLVGQLRPGHASTGTCRRSSCIAPHSAVRRHARSGPATSSPAATRARALCPAPEPIADLAPPRPVAAAAGAGTGRCSREINRRHLAAAARRPGAGGADPVVRDRLRHADGEARRRSTCRRRPTRRSPSTACSAAARQGFGWQCLVARRLVERGVRFVELIDTGSSRQLGLARRHGRPRPPGEERRPARSPACSRDLKQPRAARRHARRLDHRVRPHAVQQHGRRQGPRAPPVGVHAPGWPAAA